MTTVMVSGGFDPLHKGHVRLINEAAKHGKVTVALNTDSWLVRKKGYYTMPYQDRKEILEALEHVSEVVVANADDQTSCVHALKNVKPDIFANGGDRVKENIPEHAHCLGHGIEMLFNIGGDKVDHSSKIVWQERPWGRWRMLSQDDTHWVKYIVIYPHSRSSLQTHERRNEHWINLTKRTTSFIQAGDKHRLVNSTDEPMHIIEVATGKPDENDITRIEDDYDRHTRTSTVV